MSTNLTQSQIDDVRTMRGCNVPWVVIGRRLGLHISDMRDALGLPVFPVRASPEKFNFEAATEEQ